MHIDTVLKNIKSLVGPVYRKVVPYPTPDKGTAELSFWKREYEQEGRKFENSWYRRDMLAMAGEEDGAFLADKIVADFGCGPRGSLEWATSAKERIGIDVLADVYKATFDLSVYSMRFVTSTEDAIPLPSNYVDVLFTANAIDHVDNFERMCNELLRVLKPGGDFIGSFNLHEPPTPCEPQSLDENLVKKHLLNHLHVRSYRVAPKGPREERYLHFWDNRQLQGKEEAYLWVRATKPS
jgi:ubiquinone/menaquinone biosynthesis C-methylase UbiE